jgi:hypothetical protein
MNIPKSGSSVTISIFLLLTGLIYSQDARFYYEGLYYNGPYIDLKIGETKYVTTDGDECCVDILNSNAAVKASTDTPHAPYLPHIPAYFFFYTESDFPEVFGTDQYENVRLKVECLPKASTYKEMPQPQIFVPFDFSSKNPHPENDHHLLEAMPGHRMLVLRRAFFWENSESIGGWHGPYGDIKIEAHNPIVLQYTDEQLVKSKSLWHPHVYRSSDLSGPIWSGYAQALYPDPYDEWIDGPFGCIYSNIAVWDWGVDPNNNQEIAIIIAEADSPNEYMGKSSSSITPLTEGPILIKVWGFGWVVLENIWVPNAKETNIDNADVYWYGGWDGIYPAHVYGPTNAAVPTETSYGSQFKPFIDDSFWKFHNNSAFDGWTVGLLGSNFPACTLDRPRTYAVSDSDKPAVFGQ